jgi:hypothetical protein
MTVRLRTTAAPKTDGTGAPRSREASTPAAATSKRTKTVNSRSGASVSRTRASGARSEAAIVHSGATPKTPPSSAASTNTEPYDDASFSLLLQRHESALTQKWVVSLVGRSILVMIVVAISIIVNVSTLSRLGTLVFSVFMFLAAVFVGLFWYLDSERSTRNVRHLEAAILDRANRSVQDFFIHTTVLYKDTEWSNRSRLREIEPLLRGLAIGANSD